MNIHPRSWHYRLFLGLNAVARVVWPESIIFHASSAERVDLCTYIRTLTWTGPLSILAIIAGWASILWLLISPMMKTNGFSLSIVAISTMICGAWFGFVVGVTAIQAWLRRRNAVRLDGPYVPKRRFSHRFNDGIDELFRLIALAYLAAKQRICPILEVGS